MATFMDIHSGFVGRHRRSSSRRRTSATWRSSTTRASTSSVPGWTPSPARSSASPAAPAARASCESTSARAIPRPRSTSSRSRCNQMTSVPSPNQPLARHHRRRRRPVGAAHAGRPVDRDRRRSGRARRGSRRDRQVPLDRRPPRRPATARSTSAPTTTAAPARWASTTCSGDLVGDGAINPLTPEALVYEPMPGGQLRLVGVEYVVVQGRLGHAPLELHPSCSTTRSSRSRRATATDCRTSTSSMRWIWRAEPERHVRELATRRSPAAATATRP